MIVLADERGQRMVRLVCADSKATVTTIYNCGDEKSISEHTTHLIHLRWILNSWTEPHLKIPLAHQNWIVEDLLHSFKLSHSFALRILQRYCFSPFIALLAPDILTITHGHCIKSVHQTEPLIAIQCFRQVSVPILISNSFNFK